MSFSISRISAVASAAAVMLSTARAEPAQLDVQEFIDNFLGCEKISRAQILSPDAQREVLEFESSCGATTPFSLQLFVKKAGVDLDIEKEQPFLVIKGRELLEVKWLSPREISVLIPRGSGRKIYFRMYDSAGVDINYRY